MRLLIVIVLLALSISIYSQEKDSLAIHLDQYGAGYFHDFFDDNLSSWNTLVLNGKFAGKRWTLIPAVHLAQRFDEPGAMLSLDAYRSLKNKDYYLIEGSYSPSIIFPQTKLGFEYFNPFGKWEHSVGARFFNFQESGSFLLVNTSLSRYYGKNLTMFRVNGAWAADGADFTNYSFLLQQRYYRFDDAFISGFISYGFDTSLIILSDNASLGGSNPYVLAIGATYGTRFLKRHQWTVGYTWSKYEFGISQRNQHSLSLYYNLKRRGHESH